MNCSLLSGGFRRFSGHFQELSRVSGGFLKLSEGFRRLSGGFQKLSEAFRMLLGGFQEAFGNDNDFRRLSVG